MTRHRWRRLKFNSFQDSEAPSRETDALEDTGSPKPCFPAEEAPQASDPGRGALIRPVKDRARRGVLSCPRGTFFRPWVRVNPGHLYICIPLAPSQTQASLPESSHSFHVGKASQSLITSWKAMPGEGQQRCCFRRHPPAQGPFPASLKGAEQYTPYPPPRAAVGIPWNDGSVSAPKCIDRDTKRRASYNSSPWRISFHSGGTYCRWLSNLEHGGSFSTGSTMRHVARPSLDGWIGFAIDHSPSVLT